MPDKKTYISKAPIRRLMKNEGAKLVSSDAVDFLIELLIKETITVVKGAVTNAEADNRKRIQNYDISESIKSL